MTRVNRKVILWLLLLWASSVRPASAEWFGDLYLGGALTGTGTQDIDADVAKFRHVRFDTSLAVGGRGGYWFDDFDYLGLALDVVHFRPDVGAQTVRTDQGGPRPLAKLDLEVFGLSIDLLLRYPLWRDEQFPTGRLQPYVLVGPLVGITTARDSTNFGPPNGQSHTSSPARYLAFHPSFQFGQAGKVDLHINTQLLLGGVSGRF